MPETLPAGLAPDQIPDRAEVLARTYRCLSRSFGISAAGRADCGTGPAPAKVAHPLLLRTLQADPAAAALLPVAPASIALGLAEHAPFFLSRTGLLLLPPALLGSSGALGAAARWGFEAAILLAGPPLPPDRLMAALAATLRHGAALVHQLGEAERDLIVDLLPQAVAAALADDPGSPIAAELLAWQASRVEGLAVPRQAAPPIEQQAGGELALPLEHILVAGGDSRLVLDRRTGLNRYGTVARPRPEAVHFSSSTASSVSDYGFMLADLLRRELARAAVHDGVAVDELRRRMTDAVSGRLAALIGIGAAEADLVLAPSGSDTELLAVMLALAAADRPLTNVLIAPEETGRAVALAGAGRYFDDVAGSGAPVRKGEEAWPGRAVEVVQVAIRAPDGRPRPNAAIEAELRTLVAAELARGRRVLLHMLACSKTGISAPSPACIAELAALAPERIDVVVDACQMRTPFEEIALWARHGWMIQLSGSKFFTGPPFSGALSVPPQFRARAGRVRDLLAAAPGVGGPDDWNPWWRERLTPTGCGPASFGLLLRWVPALAEADLAGALPALLCRWAFDRFRARLVERLARSQWLTSIDPPDPPREAGDDAPADLATRSIVCFGVAVADQPGGRRPLGARECQRLFELLNLDLSRDLGPLRPAERIVAAQCAHIGQPVTLAIGADRRELSILRLVVGARFFTIVGYAGAGAVEAALESEISDAIRAIEKLELVAMRWPEITGSAMR